MIFKLHILSSYVTLLKKYPVAAIKGNLHHALEIVKVSMPLIENGAYLIRDRGFNKFFMFAKIKRRGILPG